MGSKKTDSMYDEDYDLTNCSAEPLRYIRRIQAHGKLIVADLQLKNWFYASSNIVEKLKISTLETYLKEILSAKELRKLKDDDNMKPINVTIGDEDYLLIKHVDNELIYLEFEGDSKTVTQMADLDEIHASILSLSQAESLNDFLDTILSKVKRITGFDHVMIYEFDHEYNGKVIRELKENSRPSYLGIKFPASDIPEQARALYFEESIRTIANVEAEQIALEENSGNECEQKINLSKIHIRGVSPIHLEYLSNINVDASFSVAIIKSNKLWGLIVCHHTSPKIIDFTRRKWLRFLSNIVSSNINALSREVKAKTTLQRNSDQKSILHNLFSSGDLVHSVVNNEPNVLSLISADGVILKSSDALNNKGNVPNGDKVEGLIKWLGQQGKFDVLHTSKSIDLLPAEIYDHKLPGLLVIQLSQPSQDFIIFFRKVESQDVMWAGDPSKTKSFDNIKGRLTPRKSFAKWIEKTKDTSISWTAEEVETAHHIKNEIRDLLYQKYNELDLLHKELDQAYKSLESFSYTVSHDLKSPLRSIDGLAQMLLEDHAENLDDQGINLLDMIISSITKMNSFIEGVLRFSKLNKKELSFKKIDLNKLLLTIWKDVQITNPRSTFTIAENIPMIYGDYNLITQIFTNLISNSVKYQKPSTDPILTLDFEEQENFILLTLGDNGIGIPDHLRKNAFEIFRRLVGEDEYEGTGIGLAIVKKVVERHKGEIRIESNNGGGTQFIFTLPTNQQILSSD